PRGRTCCYCRRSRTRSRKRTQPSWRRRRACRPCSWTASRSRGTVAGCASHRPTCRRSGTAWWSPEPPGAAAAALDLPDDVFARLSEEMAGTWTGAGAAGRPPPQGIRRSEGSLAGDVLQVLVPAVPLPVEVVRGRDGARLRLLVPLD